VLDDLDVAAQCHDDGLCPAGTEDYPFQNVGDNWSQYLGQVWGAADAWAGDAVAQGAADVVHPLQHIAVVASQADPNEPLGTVGLAFLGIDVNFGDAGGGLALGTSHGEDFHPVMLGRAIAHEIGHTYGLMHDSTTVSGVPSFMNSSGGAVPRLGETVESNIVKDTTHVPEIMYTQYEAWAILAPNKRVPRPVGFSHTGCSPGHCPPGLDCQNTVQGSACVKP